MENENEVRFQEIHQNFLSMNTVFKESSMKIIDEYQGAIKVVNEDYS